MRLSIWKSIRSAANNHHHSSSAGAMAPRNRVSVRWLSSVPLDALVSPLTLLMKLNPFVSKLSHYDIDGTPGVTADVSHINTRSEVAGYLGEEQLGQALEGSDVVIIPADVRRKPGMTRD